jgi:hypothetical protein
MDPIKPTTPTVSPDVVAVDTTPRPTPRPARVPFSEVLSTGGRALVRGAQATVQSLPGSPLMALAVRPGSTSSVPTGAAGIGGGASVTPEGPGAAVSGGLGTGTGAADGSIESTMAQDQEMNLYYLQIQEQVNAQNRTFTALSNVMEVEHNTAKAAIGNIH